MENIKKDESEAAHPAGNQPDTIIPVIREDVVIGKRLVKKGKVLIEKKVNTEEISVEVPLMTEDLEIQRVPLNQYIDDSPEIRYDGDTVIIPVLKEVMVKRLLLVEEIRITKKVQKLNKTENVTIRKEEVKITRKEQ